MRKIGKYEIIEEIGSGSMGTVYKARHPGLGKIVAVKVLSLECGQDADLMARFERKARIMADLPDYRHVVQVYDAGKDDGRYWYAMEYIPGSLADYLGEPDAEKTRVSSPQVIDVKTAVDIAFQVLSGLVVIHAAGVIHRDLCPQNIVLKAAHPDPIVKITDFGIAGKKGGKLTKTGMWGGHEFYAAPEPWSESGPHSDIYSLGVLMYRMVTGRNPAGRFKDPGVLNQEVGPALNDCIIKCMEQDPEDRYQSPAEMRRDLEKLLHGKEDPYLAAESPSPDSTFIQEIPKVSDIVGRQDASVDKGVTVIDQSKRITKSIGKDSAILLKNINIAIDSGKSINIRYRSYSGAYTQRIIYPKKIYESNGSVYLEAHCSLRDEKRTFRVDRILSYEKQSRPSDKYADARGNNANIRNYKPSNNKTGKSQFAGNEKIKAKTPVSKKNNQDHNREKGSEIIMGIIYLFFLVLLLRSCFF